MHPRMVANPGPPGSLWVPPATFLRMGAAEELPHTSWTASGIRKLRRVEYDQLVSAGAFEGERVELLEGMVIEMAPHGPEHAGTIDVLSEMLRRGLALHGLEDRTLLRVQSAFDAGAHSCPEPDLAVVPRRDYRAAHPNEAHLVIEVAKTSVPHDQRKAPVYAAAGVPEYWIVDVGRRCVLVHRALFEGSYEEITTHRAPEVLRVGAFPAVEMPLSEIF